MLITIWIYDIVVLLLLLKSLRREKNVAEHNTNTNADTDTDTPKGVKME